MKAKQVIFDLGGVLVEWNPRGIAERFSNDTVLRETVLREIIQHPDWLELDRGAFSEQQAAARIAARSSLPETLVHQVFATVRESLIAIAPTVQLLHNLAERDVPCYGLSNMSAENYQYLLGAHGFFECFNGVVVSGYEKIIKPQPEIYQLVCRRFALNPSETLFIDDTLVNCQAAQNAGMQALHFNDRAENIAHLRRQFL